MPTTRSSLPPAGGRERLPVALDQSRAQHVVGVAQRHLGEQGHGLGDLGEQGAEREVAHDQVAQRPHAQLAQRRAQRAVAATVEDLARGHEALQVGLGERRSMLAASASASQGWLSSMRAR